MPPALTYSILDDQDLYDAGHAERVERTAIQNKSDAYYDNQAPNPLNFDPLTPDLNVKINLFQERIDRRVSFLFPALPDFELDDDESVVNADEEWLGKAWEQSGNAVIAGQMCLFGAKYGHVFVKVLPGGKLFEYPRIVLMKDVIGYWQADDVDVTLWYEYMTQAGRTLFRQDTLDLEALGIGVGWEIREYTATVKESGPPKASDWTLTKQEEWPFDCPPMIAWQHWPKAGEYYGGSEAGDLDLNDAYNRVATQISEIMQYFAAPRVIGVGVDSANDKLGAPVNGIWTVANKDAKFQLLESSNRLADTYAFLDRIEAAYRRQGRYVVLSDADNLTNITNLGLQLRFKSMVDANTTLQHQYGMGLKKIVLALLCVGGQNYAYTPELHWPDALPTNDFEQANVVTIEKKLDLVSDETASEQLGLDAAEEKERMADDKPEPAQPTPVSPMAMMMAAQLGKNNQQPPNGLPVGKQQQSNKKGK